jgi:3-oxoacyl-[acyl-carrier protein] reductase
LRVVVVSGGGTGIGRATAQVFAADGDRVVILGRRGDVLERAAAELGAVAIQADLTDPAQVEAAVASLPEVVDVLVNNAGGVPEIDVEGGALGGLARFWDAVWRSNVVSAVLLTEALLPRLRRPGGRIVNLSSIAALRGNGAYGAAKAGIVAWTYSLAKRLGAEGITANAVAPGYVEDTEFFGGEIEPERRQRLVDETLVGRPATPEDVAATIHFLASEGASHITGQVLQVNGGALLGR